MEHNTIKNVSEKETTIKNFITNLLNKFVGTPERGFWKENDNMFNEGMDSLLAIQFKNAIEKELKISLPTKTIYEHPSIKTITLFLLKQCQKAN